MVRRKKFGWAGVGLALLIATGTARADQVIFKNGDRISGTIKSADGGKLVIDTAAAGTLTIDMSKVKTFSTDAPVKLQLDDGTTLNYPITTGADGLIEVSPPGQTAWTVPIGKVAKINPPPVKWTGSIALNGLLTTGNVTSEQFGASANAVRRGDDDRITLAGAYLFAEQKVNNVDTTTENNWFLEGKYDYFFTKRFYGYGDMRAEKDVVNHLDLRLTPGVGVGYQWIEQPDENFNTEGGISWVYQDYNTLPAPEENVSVRLAEHYDKTLWDARLKFIQDIQLFPSIQNTENFLALFDVGFHVDLTHNMFSELKTELDYDSNPGPGTKRLDQKYILGVGWNF